MLTYPEPCDSAPSLPSHAGASGTGFIDEPSLQRLWLHQHSESHMVGLPGGPGNRETWILIPAWCSEGPTSGPHWSFQTLSGPCKSGVLPIQSLQLMARWSLGPPRWDLACTGLCCALCPVPSAHTLHHFPFLTSDSSSSLSHRGSSSLETADLPVMTPYGSPRAFWPTALGESI